MKDTFNSDFYITAATVIPLLYITLFLQGQVVQNLSLRFVRAFRRSSSLLDSYSESDNLIIALLSVPASALLGGIAALVVCTSIVLIFVGLIAEGLSLLVLYLQKDSVGIREFILWSMMGLLILISLGPVATITRSLIAKESPGTSDEKPDSTEDGNQK